MWLFKDEEDKKQETSRAQEERVHKIKKASRRRREGTKKNKSGAIEMSDLGKCQVCRKIYILRKGDRRGHCAECVNTPKGRGYGEKENSTKLDTAKKKEERAVIQRIKKEPKAEKEYNKKECQTQLNG